MLLNMQWDGFDGAHIQGHVLAAGAITAGGRLDQAACFITQGNGDAIQLGLGDIADVISFQRLDYAVVEVLNFLRRECIGQRQHGCAVAHRLETFCRLPPHTLGG